MLCSKIQLQLTVPCSLFPLGVALYLYCSLVGDWDGDGKDNIAVRRGYQILMDTNFDSTVDKVLYFGNGNSEDDYLVGDWDGDGKDNIAVRRGNQILIDTNFDGSHDKLVSFGDGNSDRYLVGDWNGDGKDEIGVRRGKQIILDTNILTGTSGNDYLYGNNNVSEILYGRAGNDYIDGTIGLGTFTDSDTLYGGSGNDFLIATGSGRNKLYGEAGNDTLQAGQSSNNLLDGGIGDDDLVGSSQGHDTLYGGTGNDSLNGGWGKGNDLLYGGDGNDRLDGGWYDSDTSYGEGNDTLFGENGNDTLYGGHNNDSLDGGAGNDLLYGENDNDILNGGDGNDTLIGGAGQDTLYGGNGDDQLNGSGSVLLDGEGGNDVIYTTATTSSATRTITGGSGADKFFVDIQGDVTLGLNFDAQRLANFIGDIVQPDQTGGQLATNLVLGGLQAAASFIPIPGAQFAFGWLTSAISTGVNFAFDEAELNDRKAAADAAVAEYGNSDWGTVTQTQRDLIKIKDFAIGEDNIVLPSIADNSSYQYQAVIGAGGTFIKVKIGTAYTTDVLFIENQYRGQVDGLDDAQFTGLIADLLNPQTGVIGVFKSTPISQFGATVEGTFAYDQLNGKNEAQEMVGGYGDDVITGNGGNDVIYGGTKATQGESFNSTLANLYANDGNDILSGGDGNDKLYGETGNDFLVGGTEQDTLTGGTGADKFTFNSLAEGIDTITDFKRSEGDKIHIDGSGFGANSTSQFSVNYSTDALSFNGQQFATLQGIASTTDFNVATDLVIV